MNDPANCGDDYTAEISISTIGSLIVKFNGSPIDFEPVHKTGTVWKIEIEGVDIPEAGTITFWDGEALITSVEVLCD